MRFDEFVQQDEELLEGGGFVGGEEADDFFPGLAIVDVEFLFNPGLKFRKLFFLIGFRNAGLAAGKEVA